MPELEEEVGVWHIVRTHDSYYAETVRGTRAEAEAAAAAYRPNSWTEPGLAHVVEGCPVDYPATVSARKMYGDDYADYIQRSTDEKLAKGIDRREESLGSLLRGNDGI